MLDISKDTKLNYSLLVQRVRKKNNITYSQLIKPSLFTKFTFNKKYYSAKEFSLYLGINIKTFYRWKKKGLSPDEMFKKKKERKAET